MKNVFFDIDLFYKGGGGLEYDGTFETRGVSNSDPLV